MAGWNHDNANWKPKQCAQCGGTFVPKSGVHKYCRTRCKEQAILGKDNTTSQYARISGRWDKYFSRLCSQKHRKGVITRDDCLRILKEQDGKCALSGETLTCILNVGNKTATNASLDRKNPDAGYHPDNVQLVCAVLNSFRNNVPLPDFVDWCKKVADHAQKTRL